MDRGAEDVLCAARNGGNELFHKNMGTFRHAHSRYADVAKASPDIFRNARN